MMKKTIAALALLCMPMAASGQNVSIYAVDQPAPAVFRTIMAQTGKNFVYSSELLRNVRISVKADKRPLKEVLADMFRDTDIEYKVKGKNVVLKRKGKPDPKNNGKKHVQSVRPVAPRIEPEMTELKEIVVMSRLEAPSTATAEIGARKITSEQVLKMPMIFGEADVIKSLHMLPGVTDGTEGMAGMHVHGGNSDENLYMLDNVPLYQVNHFAGLFSAFNPDLIRYVDFFKSSIPAKYDGRLSSFMDVRLKNGFQRERRGTARLGLTSGAFNLSGPIGTNTSYVAGIRRSWFDVLSVPLCALLSSQSEETVSYRYHFMDLNARVDHRFTPDMSAFVSLYFGDDQLNTSYKDKDEGSGWYSDEKYSFQWGNLVAQAGVLWRLHTTMTSEFTAAYTRYFTRIKTDELEKDYDTAGVPTTHDIAKTDNNINDWIFKGDFDWQPDGDLRLRFGAGYVFHSFLPSRRQKTSLSDGECQIFRDSTWTYHANEVNGYVEADRRLGERWHANIGLHLSLFDIDGNVKHGISPRATVAWTPTAQWAVKGAYSRTTQYVHQLRESYISLPTDQWIPMAGNLRPETADKISAGGYWESRDGGYGISAEGYWKWMRNLVEYRDEYYLQPPLDMWNRRLTTGKGTAKGIDVMLEKKTGKITGHLAYSLAWADRTFSEKNDGHRYPARFDNRHTINLVLSWNVSDKVSVNAAWTGHSGNRFTFHPQVWEAPVFGENYFFREEMPLKTPINNYQLPFYHRLDLSCWVRNKRGYWTFSLYNAYNHMNVVGIKKGYRERLEWRPGGSYYAYEPVFQKIKLLPVIPSVSYTWEF